MPWLAELRLATNLIQRLEMNWNKKRSSLPEGRKAAVYVVEAGGRETRRFTASCLSQRDEGEERVEAAAAVSVPRKRAAPSMVKFSSLIVRHYFS